MADFTLTVFDTNRDGVNVTDNDTSATTGNNYFFQNDGRVKLLCASTPGANVTVETTVTVEGLAVTDNVKAVPATKQVVLGPFPMATYNDSQGRAKVTVSANCDIIAIRG